jgi:hypothetical protein
MLDCFSPLFAERYGLKDALILSEICAVTRINGNTVGSLDLMNRFPYLTKDQIRKGLVRLMNEGLLEYTRVIDGFTRELRYRAIEEVVQEYVFDISGSYTQGHRETKNTKKKKA